MAEDGAGRLSVELLALGGMLLCCLLWSHWRTLGDLISFWSRNEDYSVGMLVPFVAIWLVWRKRVQLRAIQPAPDWVALSLLSLSECTRLFGLYFGIGSGERVAFVMSIAGLVWLVLGRQIFWRLRWVFVFLLLMVPFPARLHEIVALPLQRAATSMTVFGLELAGFFVVREGNVLRLDESTTVAVTEACSGLRMLTAFLFVAAVLAFLIERPRWERILLVLLGIPIAVFSNGVRGFVTACFMHYAGSELVSQGFHDMAGWAMMPLALLMFLGAVRLFDIIAPAGSGVRPASRHARNTESTSRRPRTNSLEAQPAAQHKAAVAPPEPSLS